MNDETPLVREKQQSQPREGGELRTSEAPCATCGRPKPVIIATTTAGVCPGCWQPFERPRSVDEPPFRKVVEWLHHRMAAAQNQPYEEGDVCLECADVVREQLVPLMEAALRAASQPVSAAMHEPRLYAAEGPVTGHDGKYTVASVGCTCGWNSDGKSYNKEGDWDAHLREKGRQEQPHETLRVEVGNVLDHWEQLPNDLRSDPGFEALGKALTKLWRAALAATPATSEGAKK